MNACTHTPSCKFEDGHQFEHPCGQRREKPGEPCRHCSVPVPLDGTDCPTCWRPATVADLKHLAALAVRSVDHG